MTSHAEAGPSSQSREDGSWPPRLYLAVDCGGTKAAAAICDEDGRLIGKGRGGPSNFTDEGLLSFLNSVEEAIKDALKSVRRYYNETLSSSSNTSASYHNQGRGTYANDDMAQASISEALQAIKPPSSSNDSTPLHLQAAWFGIAGVDSPLDVTTLSPHLASLLDLPYPSERLIVANDTSLLASPITDASRPDIRSGVVAIAGTGSIVMSFKRSQNGMLKVLGRVGGFGWLLGDEGSGYSVGRAAVRQVLDLADRERLAREREEDNSDSEVEEEEEAAEEEGQGTEVDLEILQGTMSRDFSSINGSGNVPSISDDDDNLEQSLAEMKESHKNRVPYGQLLRDRILQDWGLLSTDELLRAVYFDDAPSSQPSLLDGVPSISRIASSPTDSHTLSDATVRSSTGTAHLTRTAIPFSRPEASSINLLPPSGPTIDEETRLLDHSPIPSLGSSFSTFGSTANSKDGRGKSSAQSLQSQVNESANTTEVSSIASSCSTTESGTPRATSERKHRLASLTPLVFHLAFTHGDELCLDILQSQACLIAIQIRAILLPSKGAKAHLSSQNSVLCLGGGLVSQQRYRDLLVKELAKLDIVFADVEYVADPATRGATALSSVLEKRSTTATSR